MTHTPSAKELEVFLPLMCLRCPMWCQLSVELGARANFVGIWSWSKVALFELHLWTNGCVFAWLRDGVEINLPCTTFYFINNMRTSFPDT